MTKHQFYLKLFTLVLCILPSFAYAQQKEYFDNQWKPCSPTQASYYRIKNFKGPWLILKTVPTYRDGDSYVSEDTGFDIYNIVDYYISDEPQFTCTALCQRNTGCATLLYDGKAIWYYKNGNVMQTATYNSGQLNGDVNQYDEEGNEINKTKYVQGKEISDTQYASSVFEWLVGDWKSERITSDLSHLRTTVIISVSYKDNGTLQIASVEKMEAKGTSYSSNSGPTNTYLNWKYTPINNSQGKIEFYQGGQMTERGTIAWQDENYYIYKTTFAQNSDAVGTEVQYYRQ